MMRSFAAREGLDDVHAATAAGTAPHRCIVITRRGVAIGGRWHGCIELLASGRQACGLCGAGEEAVVADAVEAFWEHVDQEAANELGDVERHRGVAGTAFGAIV